MKQNDQSKEKNAAAFDGRTAKFRAKKTRRKRASDENIQLAEQVFQATVSGHLNEVVKAGAAGVSAVPALYAEL
ncbi:hypothetical protein G6L94_16625 [Agrobacterium rhizogenes]|uniref:hypothetical protein n=1 Tax=Rhizobium rhizogenes TaxID=359 RepID=UPI0011471FE7|nr:hypothetical protein [Rhizobium rhizogenes]NTH13570.1 hypothetical protein [Rhizobium rhizogenes]NTI49947.1 hypothetical protein [Rhizobium rhizogenes]NTI95318.1 hypothetical protein [Rhizobium rhizogenes]NTJ57786.1 hypothetical protein [Rhizobium rhizogenes]